MKSRNGRSDGGEKGDHQRVAEGYIEFEQGHIITPGDQNDEGDEESSHHGSGDVVPWEGTDEAGEGLTEEENDPGKSDRMDEVKT